MRNRPLGSGPPFREERRRRGKPSRGGGGGNGRRDRNNADREKYGDYPDEDGRPPRRDRDRDTDRDRPRRGGRGRGGGGRKGEGRGGKRGDNQRPPFDEKPKEEKPVFFNSKKPVVVTDEGEKVVVPLDAKFKVRKELNDAPLQTQPPVVAPVVPEPVIEKPSDHGPRPHPPWDRKEKHEKIELTRPKADSNFFKNSKLEPAKPAFKEKEPPELSKATKFVGDLDYIKKEPHVHKAEQLLEHPADKNPRQPATDATEIKAKDVLENASSQQFVREGRPQNQNRNSNFNKRSNNTGGNFETKFKKGSNQKFPRDEYEPVTYQKKSEAPEGIPFSDKTPNDRPQNNNISYQPKNESDPYPKESFKKEQNPKQVHNESKGNKNSGFSGEQGISKHESGNGRFSQKKPNVEGKAYKGGPQNFEPAPPITEAKKFGGRQLDPKILVNSKRNSKDQPKTFFSSNVFEMLQRNED